jgi:hypothetical protein
VTEDSGPLAVMHTLAQCCRDTSVSSSPAWRGPPEPKSAMDASTTRDSRFPDGKSRKGKQFDLAGPQTVERE